MCRSLLGAVGLLVISVVMEKPIGLKGLGRKGIPAWLFRHLMWVVLCVLFSVNPTTVANALVIMSIRQCWGFNEPRRLG
ncbi:MAG: hypothetical protein CM1200mP18_02830 [Gammaproteobacteria bacterium]|nr:MAG: hypothetical protein CM1200mP18_02830 [Gammaproteobacteria bacterium]